MIYKQILENFKYSNSMEKITIGFCSIITEDAHATISTPKMEVDINIRTRLDGGRNNSPILHGAAVKVKYNKDLIDVFIINTPKGYIAEIDRHYDHKKVKIFQASKIYKVTKKFIEKNGKELVLIWETREGSKEYNKLMDTIKENNPEFNYS